MQCITPHEENANVALTLKRGMHYNKNMTKLDRQRLPMIILLEFMSKTNGEVWHNKFLNLS
jgi:hypothetical protein